MCCVKAFVTNGDPAAGLCGFIIFFGQVRNEPGRAAPAQTIVCFCLFLIHHIKETKSSRMCEKIFCHAHQKSVVTRLSVFFEISTIDIVKGIEQTDAFAFRQVFKKSLSRRIRGMPILPCFASMFLLYKVFL